MKFTKLVTASAFGLIASAGASFAAECGDVSIAEMNWASAEFMANVDKIILEEGYGCDVELIPGATQTTFASMNEKGQPDIAPELWANAVATLLNTAEAEGSLVALNGGPITGLGEGWWVTKAFTEEHPELDTVEKLLEHPELFPYIEDESKGAFMGCPAGWGCQLINANLFRAYDMEAKGWTLVDPGSGAGLDGSVAKAAERGEPWFGYYWSPTSLVGKYDLQMLPFETAYAGDDNWNNCVALSEQECADPKATGWIESVVKTVSTDDFVAQAGPATEYFAARIFPGEVMNSMLVYMNENQAAGEDTAYEFLETQEELWMQWVPADVAEKIKSAL
jgi:glycine betaine/proline transport system substrate-binding protein